MHDGALMDELFGTAKVMVGMVHVQALPGTPFASKRAAEIVSRAVAEARQLVDAGFDAILIENMHDRPYLRHAVGPEIVSAMTAVGDAVASAIDKPLGVQILAGANREALAVATACGAAFIRAENFVFAHVADEGFMPEADAGPLLRYRRELGSEHVRIFADVKKKHASHAVTADVSLTEAAKAAVLFGADGIVVTGVATGEPTAVQDAREVRAAVDLPIAIGSGITPENLPGLWEPADVFIVGSYLKHDGQWHQPLDPDRLDAMMRAVERMRSSG
jgi:membrane complex biogenesis BtpA family protein